ncbi:MAG: phosphatidylglycerophosphate synthase [Legionellaceae bacterium]|nr:phosphatidylglycerophosphate synthase [Legionellaceae bacterium]HAF88130.1 phosphatidylglycerophosphate synthase [Legionellales bacterium]HCA89259.1 phosphatidylglycerophosphate synthase [Legionellales bacterium]|tara:strand:- start:1425 stop:1985 length:561 start_codon:yes stop_codon:yes gene_type:complete
MLKHLPNTLTLLRFILIIPFLYCLYHKAYEAAFYLYFVAGLTDALDGWLARRLDSQSTLGSFLDPMADKLLVALSFVSLALIGLLPWWLVFLVFLRDATISFGVITWFCCIRQRLTFQPTLLSKINTTFQLLLVTVCLLKLAFLAWLPNFLLWILMGLTALTTGATYIDYVVTWSKKAFIANKYYP